MRQDTCHFLVIEKGEPYKKGERIQLNFNNILIGRPWKMNRPDIAFESLYISRKHAQVIRNGAGFLIEDLQSKHGTRINGVDIDPNRPHEIKEGDEISLAKGLVTMVYKVVRDFEDRTITLTNIFPNGLGHIEVNPDKREVRIEGAPLNFSGKERDLFLLLYRNVNKAISYDEIKTELWPERKTENDAVPDVGSDEINALVYRLRKRLGGHGQKIVTVARYGVLLEL